MLKTLTWPIVLGYKAVIFDMDGVLFDTIGIWNMADQYVIKLFGGPELDLLTIQKRRDAFFESYHDSDGYTAYAQHSIDTYGLSCDDPAMLRDLRREKATEILVTLSLKPGVLRFIKALQQAEKKLALATNSTQKQLEDLFVTNPNVSPKLSLDTFDVILRKEDCKKSKPNPEIYLETIKRLGLKPGECIVVEDSYEGVRAAIAAGASVINVRDKYSDVNREKINRVLEESSVDTFFVERLDQIFI